MLNRAVHNDLVAVELINNDQNIEQDNKKLKSDILNEIIKIECKVVSLIKRNWKQII